VDVVREDLSFAAARATQAEQLSTAIETVGGQLAARQAEGALTGAGPIFVGIGASLAAACTPVWELRSRGIHSWRLGAGDLPLPFPASDHPIIGVSQSGRSAETLTVLESVDEKLRYAVVNNRPSPIADLAGTIISLENIPDSYASTIGYTATVAALGMLADAWDGGAIDRSWYELPEVFRTAEAALAEVVGESAGVFADAVSVDFVGTGPAVGSAEAGALLFREVARLHATGMSTRQYLHGSMESAGEGVHVLLGDTREVSVARTLSDAGHQVVLVSSEAVPGGPLLRTVQLPKLRAAQRAILEALFLQALVAEVAGLRGVNIDEFVFHHTDTKVPPKPADESIR
jgi:fructoselysine-6-P-deglycase FrlB-like protein